MDASLPAEQFLSQFSSLSDLAQELPTDAKEIDHQRVGSLLLSAVPLEAMAVHGYLTSEVGQAGISAVKSLASRAYSALTGDADAAVSGSRLTGVAGEVQQRILDSDPEEAIAEAPAQDAGDMIGNLASQATGRLTSGISDAGEALASSAADVAADIVPSTILEALGPIGAIAGVLTTLGISLKDLFDKPHDPAPVFSAFQAGV